MAVGFYIMSQLRRGRVFPARYVRSTRRIWWRLRNKVSCRRFADVVLSGLHQGV